MKIKLSEIKDQTQLEELLANMVTEAVEGLSNKNSELLGKLKKAKDNTAPDDLEELQAAAKKLEEMENKTLEDQNEYKKLLEKSQEQHKTKLDAVNAQLDAEKEVTRKLLVHDGLTRELAKANVNPVLIDAAVSLLSNEVSVVELDGARVAQVGEEKLDNYVKTWSNSDVGKNFVLAGDNSGGGAGGNTNTNQADANAKHFQDKTWNLTEQAKLSKSDPAAYKALKEQYPTRQASANTDAA